LGLVHRRRSLCFLAKTTKSPRVVWDIVWQEFKGGEAGEVQVLSLVHDTHAAACEFVDDAVMRYRLAGPQEISKNFEHQVLHWS
jgi:hypothetical protein